MPDVHQVYLTSNSYYFGHKRLPSDLPLETTGDGSLENPYVPVQGGAASSTYETYDNNADAVAALGVGKLYKSSTLINGSPIILITV